MHSNLEMSSMATSRKAFLKSLMVYRGTTARELARQLHVSDSMLSQLISGKRRSPTTESRLCSMLGIAREKLWPAA